MAEQIGFLTSPHEQVQAAFNDIAHGEMHALPFVHPQMPVYVPPLALFEGQWLGCVLTPWMLSLMIFPGPQQHWPRRAIGERLGLKLPRGEMTFIVGELPAPGQYLSCSLLSPLPRTLSAEQGRRLTNDCLQMVQSLPVAEAALSRRELLFGQRGDHYA